MRICQVDRPAPGQRSRQPAGAPNSLDPLELLDRGAGTRQSQLEEAEHLAGERLSAWLAEFAGQSHGLGRMTAAWAGVAKARLDAGKPREPVHELSLPAA